jgi:hypothetical protein
MVTFDGPNKLIVVNAPSGHVTRLDIRRDVYSAWKEWTVVGSNLSYLPAMRYSGGDPIGVGLYTGDIYFLTYGWRLSVDLSLVKIIGVLYSDNFDTAYVTPSLIAQYPASVSALVNTVSIGTIITADQVWTAPGAIALQGSANTSNTKLDSIMGTLGSTAPAPTSIQNALAVRAELTAELARIDAAISTRLDNTKIPMTVSDYLALS